MRRAVMFFVWVYVVALTLFFGYKTYEVVKEHHEPAPVVEQQEVVEEAAAEEKEVVQYVVEVVFEERNPVTLEVVQAKPEETKISLGEFMLTAYCSCAFCCNEYALNRPLDENGNEIVYTASGNRAVQGVTVAVDPALIPYGTELEINGNKYIAHDCGGDIKENRIDVYFENHQDAWNFGTQYAEVFMCQ